MNSLRSKLKDNMMMLLADLKVYLNRRKSYSPNQDAIQEGWRLSNLVLREPTTLIWTPWMKNIMEHFKEVVPTDPRAGVTKAELWIESETKKLLNKYCTTKNKEYYVRDDKEPDLSYDYYATDCWRNFKVSTELRHIKPNMNKDRKVAFSKFMQPFNLNNITADIPEDIVKAYSIIDHVMPTAVPTRNIRSVNQPFMSKHSNVGYPYFKNDQAKKDGLTYAEITLRDAHRTKLADAMMYPYTALTRNMRQKARPILGSSRIFNLLCNQWTGPQIEAIKTKSPIFGAYRSAESLKKEMLVMVDMAREMRIKLKDPTIMLYNRDFSQFDTTIRPEYKLWTAAFNMTKVSGSYADQKLGKEIISASVVSTLVNDLVYGYAPLSHPIISIFGRILSGEIRTNTDGGLDNGTLTFATYYALQEKSVNNLLDQLYLYAKQGKPVTQVCGDDNLGFTNDVIQSRLPKLIKDKYGLVVNNDKGELGAFFLQRRVCNLSDGRTIMITPFTRVIRSLVTRENPTGIGPGGWILMAWSLLYQLIEFPELFKDVARLFIPFDKYELGRKLSIRQLIEMVKSEDAKVNSSRFQSTKDKLNDGDPIKQEIYAEIFSGKESEYLRKIHKLLREV